MEVCKDCGEHIVDNAWCGCNWKNKELIENLEELIRAHDDGELTESDVVNSIKNLLHSFHH